MQQGVKIFFRRFIKKLIVVKTTSKHIAALRLPSQSLLDKLHRTRLQHALTTYKSLLMQCMLVLI